jgi:hypothetical protein
VVAAITAVDALWLESRASVVVVMPCVYGVLGAAHCAYETSDLYHLGSMDWLPNVVGIRWFANSVWPRVRAGEAGARFHLAGRDSDRIGLNTTIPGFEIHGPVDDAAAFIRDHGILVVPLHAGSGMRIKIIEAMAHGKPIISTRIGAEGIPLTSGHDAILADSAEAFAEAVLLLVRDAGARRRLGGNAWRLARSEFDEAAIARRFLRRLQEVV